MARKSNVDVPDFPKKLFYKINEVATITGVEAYVLRYWENKFPMLAPEKDENDQRRYRQKDIELLFYIKKLLYENKYTIAGAVEVLKQEKSGGRRRKGKKGEESAEPDEPEVVLIVEEDDKEESGSGKKGRSGKDTSQLKEARKRMGAVRKEIQRLLADVRKWRSTLGSGSN